MNRGELWSKRGPSVLLFEIAVFVFGGAKNGGTVKNGGTAKNGGWQCQKIENVFIGSLDSHLHELSTIVVKKGT